MNFSAKTKYVLLTDGSIPSSEGSLAHKVDDLYGLENDELIKLDKRVAGKIAYFRKASLSNDLFRVKSYMEEKEVDETSASIRILKSSKKDPFQLLGKWEGYIEKIENGEIVARVKDLIESNAPEEELTFSVDDVDEDDKFLLKKGAVFYWQIGYLDNADGRLKTSRFRFRRLPEWTSKDIAAAEREANEFDRAIRRQKGSASEGK